MIRKMVSEKLPRSSKATFQEISKILKMGLLDVPEKSSYMGTGTPGRLLEDLLGLKENNNDSPDYKDWEIKYHGGKSLITLLHKDPEPKGVLKSLVHEHGWENAKGQICFRHTLRGSSERGFYVVNEIDRILVRNRNKDIVVPFWTHNTIMGAAGSKLRRLIVVDGKYKKSARQVIYNSATAYWGFKITQFCDAVDKGIVLIDFDARTTGGVGTSLRDHGTKFRISPVDLPSLYEHSKKIT